MLAKLLQKTVNTPLPLRIVFQLVLSVPLGVDNPIQKAGAGFPGNLASGVHVPQGMATALVFAQYVGYQLPFDEVGVIEFYVVICNVHPES
jgi:hypothetical protein